MIEIARFADVYEAEIVAARLRADGYDPVLGGAEHVKANPLVLQALGGVNLSVPLAQADAARVLIERLRGGAERIGDDGPVAARPVRWKRPLALFVAIGLGILAALTIQADAPPSQFWARGYW